MTTKAIDKPAKTDQTTTSRRPSGKSAKLAHVRASTSAMARKREALAEQHSGDGRATKQALLLQLLNRSEGATIPEMMQAAGWQQHSVRGFLAGTVKKKLGFTLTSSKEKGELRRYRIKTRRGR
jgi:uncharacterized protein DUF3489